MPPIKTRIAPSPTGDPHVGTAYIALFNYCFAKSQGGHFVLRIEDTDQVRSTAESEQAILDSLRWLGLDWDEGPDVGGPCGPYRQSERREIYQEHAQRLLQSGHAFYCFRTAAELDAIRQERQAQGLNPGIKGDLELPAEEVEKRLAAGEPHVIRLKVPDSGVCRIQDRLRGEIEIDWALVDSQILMKSDGMPTYHLANVVDDHLMGITHVIRGEEWISSAPKHVLLYEAFGWEMPELCHMPLLRNPDGSKLSKRKNPVSIRFYHQYGILPEALLNYLGRMGWSMPDEREKFNLQEMIEHFDLQRISLGGPVFDQDKLRWLNGCYLREDYSASQFREQFNAWRNNDAVWDRILPQVQGRVSALSDIVPMAAFLFAGDLNLSEADYEGGKLEGEDRRRVLLFTAWSLEKQAHWSRDDLFAELKTLCKQMGLKMGDFMRPIFISIAGTPNSWSVVDSMEILGREMSLYRLRRGVEVHGEPGKKVLKRLQKEYENLAP